MKGFSLLELLIVIAVIAILAGAGAGFYMNYGKSVEIKSVSQSMLFDLKMAQSKSMIGEGGLKWGVHFVNGAKDYYEILSTTETGTFVYSTSNKTIISTVYLPSSVSFSTPTLGNSTDIIFNKISGGTSLSSVSIIATNITMTISVSTIGNISVQ